MGTAQQINKDPHSAAQFFEGMLSKPKTKFHAHFHADGPQHENSLHLIINQLLEIIETRHSSAGQSKYSLSPLIPEM